MKDRDMELLVVCASCDHIVDTDGWLCTRCVDALWDEPRYTITEKGKEMLEERK